MNPICDTFNNTYLFFDMQISVWAQGIEMKMKKYDESDLGEWESMENFLTYMFFITPLIVNNIFIYWTYVLLLIFYRVRMRRDQKMKHALTTVHSTSFNKLSMPNSFRFLICVEKKFMLSCIKSWHFHGVLVYHLFIGRSINVVQSTYDHVKFISFFLYLYIYFLCYVVYKINISFGW